jgi:hypothetical protein
MDSCGQIHFGINTYPSAGAILVSSSDGMEKPQWGPRSVDREYIAGGMTGRHANTVRHRRMPSSSDQDGNESCREAHLDAVFRITKTVILK